MPSPAKATFAAIIGGLDPTRHPGRFFLALFLVNTLLVALGVLPPWPADGLASATDEG